MEIKKILEIRMKYGSTFQKLRRPQASVITKCLKKKVYCFAVFYCFNVSLLILKNKHVFSFWYDYHFVLGIPSHIHSVYQSSSNNMGKISKIWKYFEVLSDNPDKARCRTCDSVLGCKKGTTSALIAHLKRHTKQNEEFTSSSTASSGSSSARRVQSMSNQPTLNNFLPKSNLASQKILDKQIARWLAESGVPFRVIDLPSFKKLINIANDKLKVRGRNFYSKLVTSLAEEARRDIIDILQYSKSHLKSVSFTTDIWTSRNGDPFISLTMHFITSDWELLNFTPYVHPFPERHTGKNISLVLDKLIEHLGLDILDLHLFSVNDSASNMIKGIRDSRYLVQYTCDIHKIENVIKDALKKTPGMVKVITNTKKLAKLSLKSSVASQQLRAACDDCNLPYKKLVNPPNTRWSGFLMNLESVAYLKAPLSQLFSDDEMDKWSELTLTSQDWKLIEAAIKLLKPIHDTIKILESEKIPTLHRVIERIYTLNEIFKQFISSNSNNKIGLKFAKELKAALEERFPNNGSDNKFRRIANYISPSYKGIHLEKDQLEEVKIDIKLSFDLIDLHTASTNATSAHDDDDDDSALSPTSKLKKKFKAQKKQTQQESSTSSNSSELVKEFNKFEMFSLAPDDVDLLGWWKEHESMFPVLAHVAKTVLTIPSSSAKSERTFSCAGNFVTAKRNRLGAKKLEDLVILKENEETIMSFKSNNPNMEPVRDRITFDKIQIECNGFQEEEDALDHELLCKEINLEEEEDDDDAEIDEETIDMDE